MGNRVRMMAAMLVGWLLVGGVAPADERNTVEELNQAPAALAGEPVTLQGIVVRVNADILGRNFVHLVDGTGQQGETITLTTEDLPEIGDRAVVQGTLILDRDFGAGYVYPVLIEDARVSVYGRADSGNAE